MNLNNFIINAKKALENNDFESAIVILTKAINIDKNNANLFSERGVAHFHAKHYLKAIEDMNKAVQLDPNNSYRYSSRAFIKGACKMTDEAIKDYKKCIELDPEDSIAYNNLGLLQEQLGWQKQAKNNFDKADTLEGILKDRKIETNTHNNLNEIQDNVCYENKEEYSKKEIIKSIFTNKNTFKEFLYFIKNGFKLK